MSGPWAIGVDIGGTNLVAGTVPVAGGLPAAVRRTPTRPDRGGDSAVADVASIVESVIEETLENEGGSRDDIVGIGVGCPGPLNLDDGTILNPPNLDWSGYPIRDRIAEATGFDVTLDNDANCATYGEWWVGAGRGARSLVCITLGTGVGGGFIEDGRLMRGSTGNALEVGCTTIDVAGRPCRCGNKGCLEAYASGPSIAARAVEGIDAGADSVLPDLVHGDLEAITAATVSRALGAGDDFAAGVVEDTARFLGAGIANLVNLFNPERIVLVGGVTAVGDPLFVPLRAEVRRRAFDRAVDACSIVPGALPQTAGVIGAAGVFMSERER